MRQRLSTKHAMFNHAQVKKKLFYESIWTNFHFAESFHFMIVGESSTRPELNSDVEIKALFSRPTCLKPKDFPVHESIALYGAYIQRPLLCGIKTDENACFTYDIGKMSWNSEEFSIGEARSHASSTPFGNGSWIIIGGQQYFRGSPILLNTSKIFAKNEFLPGPISPHPLSDHCSVVLDEINIFISGGYGDYSSLNSVLILEIGAESKWQSVNPMQHGRFGHACGLIKTIFNTNEVIVIGGFQQDSTEIYSFSRQEWQSGPKTEQRQVFKAATIQGTFSFVVTGGIELAPHCTTKNCRLDTIYVYDHSTRKFIQHEQRLNQGRGNHVSISIPSDVDCSSK